MVLLQPLFDCIYLDNNRQSTLNFLRFFEDYHGSSHLPFMA